MDIFGIILIVAIASACSFVLGWICNIVHTVNKENEERWEKYEKDFELNKLKCALFSDLYEKLSEEFEKKKQV